MECWWNVTRMVKKKHYSNWLETSPKLKQIIYFFTKDRSVVDDLTQECWYCIIQKLEDLNLKISFEAWALTIARRKAIDYIRAQQLSRKKAKNIQDEAEIEAQINKEAAKDTKLQKIQMGIQKLPASHKIILNLFYLENLSLSEISKVLDISKRTIKSRLFYAREELKKTSINKQKYYEN